MPNKSCTCASHELDVSAMAVLAVAAVLSVVCVVLAHVSSETYRERCERRAPRVHVVRTTLATVQHSPEHLDDEEPPPYSAVAHAQ